MSSLTISHQETRVLSRGHHQNPWSCPSRAHVDTRMRTYLSTAFCKHHSACLCCFPMKVNPIMACLAAFHHPPQNRRARRNGTGGSANSGRSTGASPTVPERTQVRCDVRNSMSTKRHASPNPRTPIPALLGTSVGLTELYSQEGTECPMLQQRFGAARAAKVLARLGSRGARLTRG